jgi:hypothetical protein
LSDAASAEKTLPRERSSSRLRSFERRRHMVRKVGVGSVLLLFIALAIGCGGLSTEESKQRCDQMQSANAACMTEGAYDECVSCYEECGDDCEPSGACPGTFRCAE